MFCALTLNGEKKMEKSSFLVVGGTSGIGLEIVNYLTKQGHSVTVGSRGNHAEIEATEIRNIVLDATLDPLTSIRGRIRFKAWSTVREVSV